MRKLAQPSCPICGSAGTEVYSALQDRLFGAPGVWRMARCVNPDCGSYWLDPTPAPDDLPLAYRGYYTHSQPDQLARRAGGFRARARDAFLSRRLGYPKRGSFGARVISRLVPLMPEREQSWLYTNFYLPWVQGGRLLEIGCGSGWQLSRMKEAGWETKGLDFDPAAVETARGRGLDVDIGDVRDLHLESSAFDAIVMAHVLEHVVDPVGLLAECARLLKPGGRLVSITPNGASLGHRRFKASWRGLEPPRHIVVFTPKSIRVACKRAGLRLERVDVTTRDAANLLLASSRIRQARSDRQIEKPQFGQKPPWSLRMFTVLERIGNAFGLEWGEELVLTARKTGA